MKPAMKHTFVGWAQPISTLPIGAHGGQCPPYRKEQFGVHQQK